MTSAVAEPQVEARIEEFRTTFTRIQQEIAKFIVGQDDILEKVLVAVVCGGHVLLEGLPGLGKTALVHSVANALQTTFRRIQFTPDLLPADLLGTNILVEENGEKVFRFQQGPVFTHVLLADEINRATPKTQSALLEIMQEKTVTVANQTHRLDLPFFVLATQNPIEMDGTYPLPEAQLDRFFFKLKVSMPSHDEFSLILDRTGGAQAPTVSPVSDGATILRMGELVREVPIDPTVQDKLIHLVRATHPEYEGASDEVKRFVRYGASPRAAQAILAAARAEALLRGRYSVSLDDLRTVALPAMRHRIILSFEGEADGITTDQVIRDIAEKHLG
jgi:MoxR-like ATPase